MNLPEVVISMTKRSWIHVRCRAMGTVDRASGLQDHLLNSKIDAIPIWLEFEIPRGKFESYCFRVWNKSHGRYNFKPPRNVTAFQQDQLSHSHYQLPSLPPCFAAQTPESSIKHHSLRLRLSSHWHAAWGLLSGDHQFLQSLFQLFYCWHVPSWACLIAWLPWGKQSHALMAWLSNPCPPSIA